MQQTLFAIDTYSRPETLRFWLALWRTAKIGPLRFFELLNIFPDLETLYRASTDSLKSLGLTDDIIQAIKHPDWKSVDLDLRWAEGKNNHIITYYQAEYPQQLKEIKSAPPLLFVKGDPAILNRPQLAIVGSRNPTPGGVEHAQQFAQELSGAGLVITSGLALGIDAAAHRGCLNASGATIAVLGSSLDRIYPVSNTQLADQLVEKGALVSEFPLATRPKAEHFPQRNRIVSGLSLGVLVVEATLRSGSLITARLAGEQGREVFAIPGSIHNPLSRGCHALIRQGAKLVETIHDVIEELTPLSLAFAASPEPPAPLTDKNFLAADHQQLLKCIDFEPTSVDCIVKRSGLNTAKVTSMLTVLELKNQISSVPSGGYRRNPKG